jgi:hypothetical protein
MMLRLCGPCLARPTRFGSRVGARSSTTRRIMELLEMSRHAQRKEGALGDPSCGRVRRPGLRRLPHPTRPEKRSLCCSQLDVPTPLGEIRGK